MTHITTTIDSESQSIKPLYDKHPNIDFYDDTAEFISENKIKVGHQTISGSKIFIVTGAVPTIPNIKGLNDTPYWTYKTILRNTQLPKSLIVIGGGYIATELGYAYAALGCTVQFIVRSSLLRQEDHDIQTAFTQQFCKHHTVHLKTTPTHISYKNNQFHVSTDNPKVKSIQAEKLLIASGVTPNTKSLKLENAQVNTHENGFIQVNNCLETSTKNIWAFGDIIGRHLYRHTANYEGDYLFQTLFNNPEKKELKYPPIPHAVFSNPQIAGVGYTENQVKDKKINYFMGTNQYSSSAMGMALRADHGLVKLIFESETQKLIGGHIVGREAATMSHMLIAYMKMDATLTDLLDTIYIHPALPENIRNAARNAKTQQT